MSREIRNLIKVLTPNDLGLTGGHQAGIHVPREMETIGFFPPLDETVINPRALINFVTDAVPSSLPLTFVHYNGKLFGTSTRHEYRLTGLTRYFRQIAASVGDELELCTETPGVYSLATRRKSDIGQPSMSDDSDIVVLSGMWKTIRRGKFV